MAIDRALVTGGAGFIGSHVVEQLVERGIETIVLDDLSVGRRENLPAAATLHVGDVRDLAAVEELTASVDIVFHQAAAVSIRNSIAAFHDDATVNLLGTLNVLEAMRRTRRARKLVYASSMAVYAEADDVPIAESHATDPLSPYGIAKLASERYCLQVAEQQGFDAVSLRYFNTYGPRQTLTPYVGVITIFINRILDGQPPQIFGDGEQVRDFVHVRDVAHANMLAMEPRVKSGVYNVGSGRGVSVNTIAALLLGRLGPNLEPEHLDPQPGEPRNSVADITKAAQSLGYEPRARLETAIDDVIAWWGP